MRLDKAIELAQRYGCRLYTPKQFEALLGKPLLYKVGYCQCGSADFMHIYYIPLINAP